MISDEAIKKLLDNLKIENVVGEFVELKKTGANYKGLCPFHDDTTPSFTVSPEKQICKCFACSTGGDAIGFYQKIKNIPFNQAVRELSEKYKIDLGLEFENSKKNDIYFQIMKESHNFYKENIFSLNGRSALEYLSDRGFDTDLIKKYEIGYASRKRNELYEFLRKKGYEDKVLFELGLIKTTDEGKKYDTFRNRIIFPIFASYNNIIAFGGRTLEKEANVPKYINSSDTPIFKKSYNLFGIEKSFNIKTKGYSILMEGYMDTLTANIYGFDTTIAPLGTALTKEQVKLVKKYTDNIILCFDMDTAGRIATEKAIFLLKPQGFNIKVVEYDGAKDPDDFLRKYGKEKFLEVIKNSKEAFDFLYDYYKKEYDIENNIIAKENFIRRFNEFFLSLNNDIEKELYLKRFSQKIEISEVALKKAIYSTKKDIKKVNTNTDVNIEEKKVKTTEIEYKIVKLLLGDPSYISFFENDISLGDTVSLVINFIKENEKEIQIHNLLKEFKNYAKDKISDEEISTIVMECLTTNTDEKQNLEILKTYFRYKIKDKQGLQNNFNKKRDFIKLMNQVNFIKNVKDFLIVKNEFQNIVGLQ